MENQSDEFEYSLDNEMCKSLMLTLANPRIVNPTWFVNEGGKLYFYACALVSIQQTPSTVRCPTVYDLPVFD